MRVIVNLIGLQDPSRELEWPEGWPLPRFGEEVSLPNLPPLQVRAVCWQPEGDEEDNEPYIYLVIGNPRPRF